MIKQPGEKQPKQDFNIIPPHAYVLYLDPSILGVITENNDAEKYAHHDDHIHRLSGDNFPCGIRQETNGNANQHAQAPVHNADNNSYQD